MFFLIITMYKYRTIFGLLFVFLNVTPYSFSQDKENYKTVELDPASEHNKGLFNEQLSQLEGTFQFQVNKPNHSVILTKELLNLVESERKENENVSIEISEFITLFIPSSSVISNPSFESLETVLYIEDNSVLETQEQQ